MKFSVNQSELQNALAVVVKGSSTRSTLSILAGVYIKAEEGRIILQTTNLELSIKVTCFAMVEEPGETVVPAKLFGDIIKNLPIWLFALRRMKPPQRYSAIAPRSP